ncbi:MAG: efflux RND transporter periplasmic adaptor subunit [Paludibacter sp.]|nr:efflux RND transporter periplasmic adaptor subunit [Bacteroidales bacterium]MCM1068963.1 efflux RND transporter periplasmic adaptor subunit [Prevotella sp.]MCM1353626.1 efflux RND transporter periplasmic adaptor subunit [Bacteroides sp.]MCM1442025.1 efflux RND transporter periplasmic adaptor subunit [Muribaculum sp.]MCM1481519.1 efflux RND transporter periplasmic adaptor subunit [Paludibacter sp.]
MKKTVVTSTLLCVLLISCSKHEQFTAGNSWKTQQLALQEVSLQSPYSASIQGKQDISILPQVSGFLTKLCVTEGERVSKDQTLFIIDQVNYEAALRVAEANVKAAEAQVATHQLTYTSKQKLYDEKVISQYDLQVAENNLLTAKAQLALAEANVVNARQNLSYTVVKSPCNGVVGKLPFRVGSLVSPQMTEPLTTISDNSEMYVYFSMTEQQMLNLVRQYGNVQNAIKQMPDVELQLADNSLYTHKGRIESISGIIDRTTGSVSVRATFPNTERLLLSGGSCNILIPFIRKEIIVIPQAATYEIQNKVYTYVVVDGKAQSRLIQISNVNDGKNYIVESGLNAGETIVAEGAGFVREGEQIVAIEN